MKFSLWDKTVQMKSYYSSSPFNFCDTDFTHMYERRQASIWLYGIRLFWENKYLSIYLSICVGHSFKHASTGRMAASQQH